MNASEKTPKPLFNDGETVLCFHGPLLYEAKCVKFNANNKSPQYLIHYSGWNKSWDEWVPCPRVLKFSEENLKKQKELLATHGSSKMITKIKASSRKSAANSTFADTDKSTDEKSFTGRSASISSTGGGINTSASSTDSKKKKFKTEESIEPNDDYVIRNEIKIDIPDDLKQILNEDYEHICINNKLITLPVSKSIEMMLDEYVTYKLEKKNDKNVITELVGGLKDYFNTSLSTKLLYKSERTQYNEIAKSLETKKPCEIYGCIHFLRLFVKIGQMLSYTYWDEICIKQIIFHLEDVLRYLQTYLFNFK